MPLYTGWESLLNKYLKNFPTGFTSNYFFEFMDGIVCYRKLCSTPDTEVEQFFITEHPSRMRHAIWQDLFGKSLKDFPASKAVIKNLRLGKVAMKSLTTVKLKLLSRKYSTIPAKSLSYYPEVSNLSMDENNSTEVNIPGETIPSPLMFQRNVSLSPLQFLARK